MLWLFLTSILTSMSIFEFEKKNKKTIGSIHRKQCDDKKRQVLQQTRGKHSQNIT